MSENEYAGLGCSESDNRWYGGKVHFTATLRQLEERRFHQNLCPYYLRLERAEIGTSTRFSRRFGSNSIIRVKIPKIVLYATRIGQEDTQSEQELMQFFTRPFIILGRVYRAFYGKENTVFLIQTNERIVYDPVATVSIQPATTRSHKFPWAFLDFLKWYNPWHLGKNHKQTMAKWSSRFALGLSASVPGELSLGLCLSHDS